ncbi:MAG: hypothetical protein ACJAZP_001877 [Psychromonas sp.]
MYVDGYIENKTRAVGYPYPLYNGFDYYVVEPTGQAKESFMRLFSLPDTRYYRFSKLPINSKFCNQNATFHYWKSEKGKPYYDANLCLGIEALDEVDTRYYSRSEKVAIHTKKDSGYAINRYDYSVVDRFSGDVLAHYVDYHYNISPKHPTSVWRDCLNYSEDSRKKKLVLSDSRYLNINHVNAEDALQPLININKKEF